LSSKPHCLNLTRAGEYAISALSRLALMSSGPEGAPVPVESLAGGQRIPRAFLGKILGRCARMGIVRTKRGAAGGVALARPADRITLLQIVEACEGGYARASCVFFVERSCTGPLCGVYCALRRAEEELRVRLSGTTLADMARELGRHPDAAAAGISI